MKRVVFFALALSLSAPTLAQKDLLRPLPGLKVAAPATLAGTALLHTATPASKANNWTTIDSSATNGKPDALVFVTPNYNPGGSGATYITAPIGVWYTGGKWTIFTENRSSIPDNAAFNVFVTSPGPNAFVHTATAGESATLDHPLLNGKPDASLLVSHDYGASGPYIDATLATRYRAGRWEILTPGKSIPAGARFFVLVTGSRASGTPSGHILDLDVSRGDKNALVFATPTLPESGGSVGTIGVYWNGKTWAVFRQDRQALGTAPTFHVATLSGLVSSPDKPMLGNLTALNPDRPIKFNPGNATPVFTNWDFSQGLTGWTKTGNAFDSQPTVGDNVVATRVPGVTGLGGDYWHLPLPIGNRGKKWIGTYENHPSPTAPLGTIQGDGPTGTLTSPEFTIGTDYITFLIGGGELRDTEHVVLEVQEGGTWREVARATGFASEYMSRQVWRTTPHLNKRARIVIRDLSGGAWGHINVADFRFTNDDPSRLPADDPDAVVTGPLPGRVGYAAPLDVQGAVFGVADLHAHPAAQMGFGGRLYAGNPTVSITQFGFCEQEHGRSRTYLHEGLPPASTTDFLTGLGIVGGLLGAPLIFAASPILLNVPVDAFKSQMESLGSEGIHSGVGYPAFQNYKFSNALHHHMHIDWIRRAFDGGLRLMVAHPVNNELLGNLAPKYDGQPLDDRSVADRQLNFIRNNIVAPNASWMEIATSPSQARRIIRQGKLAVVLGLEVDALGNWRQTNAPTPAQYQAEVQRLFDQGVRHLFPVHFADNAFGGSAVSGDLFNVNNFYFNGKFQDVISGDSIGLSLKLSAPTVPVTGNYLNFNNGGRLTVAAVSDGYNRVRSQYGALRSHRNALGGTGLTAAGLDKMMSLGLIVDIDHMSQSLREQVLSQCEAASVNGVRGYPVVCGHTAFRELSFSQGETRDSHLHAAEMDQSAPLARRILGLGGMISVITCEKNVKQSPGSSVPADAPGTSKATAQLLHFASNLSGPERGIGIGTDLAMLGGFGPRFGVNAIHSEVAAGGLPGIVAGPLGLPADSTDAEKSAAQLRRTSRALSERNGVIYDQPVLDHYRYRYFYSRDYRGYERKAIHTAVQRDFLESLAIVSAGKTGETANQPGLLEGRAIVTSDTINAFCKGLRATRVEDADGYTIFKTFRNEMRAAFLVKSGNSGAGEGAGVRNVMGQIKPIWDSWQLMRTNPAHPAPLKKLVYSGTADGKPYSRDFDINLDGFAHYGMLPDALQELTNVGLDGGTRTAMFRGAEQYLKTWEKAWSMRR